jgi:hypothetical protein
MKEKGGGKNTATSGELSLRLASYRKELDQLTAEYSGLIAKKLQERTELVELLKTENDAEKADELWKKYDKAGITFSQWIADYQNRIAELTKKIHETNDLLWKSREKP